MGGLWLVGTQNDRRAAVNAGVAASLALTVAPSSSPASSTTLAPSWWAWRPTCSITRPTVPSRAITRRLFFALAAAFWLPPSPRLPWLGVDRCWSPGLAVGWARVALGVHFPFDIAGGGGDRRGLCGCRAALLRPPGALLTAIAEAIADRCRPCAERDRVSAQTDEQAMRILLVEDDPDGRAQPAPGAAERGHVGRLDDQRPRRREARFRSAATRRSCSTSGLPIRRGFDILRRLRARGDHVPISS